MHRPACVTRHSDYKCFLKMSPPGNHLEAQRDWVARPDGARAVAELRKPPVIALLQTHVYGVVPPAQSENPAIVAALPS
jgi:hypothetical protein